MSSTVEHDNVHACRQTWTWSPSSPAYVPPNHSHNRMSLNSPSCSSHRERSRLTMSVGVNHSTSPKQRHSHQFNCHSLWMSCTGQKKKEKKNHFSWIFSLHLILYYSYNKSPVSPSGWRLSSHVFILLHIIQKHAHMGADRDFFIAHLLVCLSNFLAGERTKACDEILCLSSFYLESKLSLSASSAYYLIAHWNSLTLPVQTNLHRQDGIQEKNWERGRGISGN